jgi:Sec-independent protein translocase protein TatA
MFISFGAIVIIVIIVLVVLFLRRPEPAHRRAGPSHGLREPIRF